MISNLTFRLIFCQLNLGSAATVPGLGLKINEYEFTNFIFLTNL